ncbi:MAG: ribosome assembly cofactor RimP [Salibacteraceae bacterium]
MITIAQIEELVNQKLGEGEVFLVQVHVHPGNRIVVELDSDGSVGIDDCVEVSRHIESNLDRAVEDFELEVTSSGLGRPLKHKRQFAKNIGRQVEVITAAGDTMRGTLLEADEQVVLRKEPSKKKKQPEQTQTLNWDEIKEVKTIITFK